MASQAPSQKFKPIPETNSLCCFTYSLFCWKKTMPYSGSYVGLAGGAGGFLNLSERDSDVEIIVESVDHTHRFPAHNLFLRTMSEVLKNMLDSEMSEKCTKKITITDSNATTIRQFLRFIYTGEVTASEWREVVELLSVAHKYQVGVLISICEKLLLESINLGIVCYLHDIAQLYGLPELLEETEKMILDGGFVILATEGFENLSIRSVQNIISNRLLNVENELTVLIALRKWALSECSRRRQELTKENILALIIPMLKDVRLKLIPTQSMGYIPDDIIEAHKSDSNIISPRIKFYVPGTLHSHMESLKFVVELGSFIGKSNAIEPLVCLKFSVDVSLFIMGFRLVGMFRNNFTFGSGNPMLILRKESNRVQATQFNLNSIPWKSGSTVGESIWKEVVAYFPRPARVEPFTTYSLSMTFGNTLPTRWPRTRIEANNLNTELGPIVIYTFGQSAAITELFLLPAPLKLESCGNVN